MINPMLNDQELRASKRKYWEKLKNDPERIALHREKKRILQRRRLENKRSEIYAQAVVWLRRKRIESLLLVGHGELCCKRCGFDDWRGLQIDHINGGGRKDPLTRGTGTVCRLIKWLRKFPDEAREKYQLLCANCNVIKRHERGENRGRSG